MCLDASGARSPILTERHKGEVLDRLGPHPHPLPVKNGEREQTEYVAPVIPSHRNAQDY